MENPKPLVSEDHLFRLTNVQSTLMSKLERLRSIYEKDRAEKDKTIADLREALEKLEPVLRDAVENLCFSREEGVHVAIAPTEDALTKLRALLSTLPKPQL